MRAKVTNWLRTLLSVASLFITVLLTAQAPASVDSLSLSDLRSADTSRVDAAALAADTTGLDNLAAVAVDTLPVYSISPEALDGPVQYSVRDSMHYAVREQKIYLYGGAKVQYADITLEAGVMVIDNKNSIVTAEPLLDTAGVASELPSFEQGAQAFTAKGMRYNFKTRKGIITNARTTQTDLFVLGEKTKIIAADPNDPLRPDNTIYNEDAIITTCDLDRPHYGIHSSKQKVVPNKTVIVGPSNVELGGVPTPLWLPFGFFPISPSERSGLIFPTDYTFTDVDGFGFQQIGWYFPINEHFHTSVTTDIFLRGTVRANIASDYAVKYKYQGGFDVGAARRRAELNGEETFNTEFSVVWRHQQDRKAHPYRNFSANLNFQTGDYARNNRQDIGSQITSTISSSVNYTFKFPEHPTWNLTAGLQHSQNTLTRRIEVEAPKVRFSTGAMYPFANAGTDPSAWYKKAQISYTAQTQSEFSGTDTTFFQQRTLDNALFGAQHNAAFSAPINVLKYFRLSPNIRYQQTLYRDRIGATVLDSLQRDIDFVIIGADTVSTDTIFTPVQFRQLDTTRQYQIAQSFTANVSLSTQIFGTARFKIGALEGIRHVVTPSISVGYSPGYDNGGLFDYYDVPVNALAEGGIIEERFVGDQFRFPSRPFSSGATARDQSFRIGYTLGNRVESKIRSREDSSETNIVALINNLNFSGSYDFQAEEFPWSPVNVSGAQLQLFKKLLRFNVSGGQFGVYERDAAGERIEETLLGNGKFPLRLDRLRLALSTRLTVGQIRSLIAGREFTTKDTEVFSLIDRFGISYNFARGYDRFRRGANRRPWETSASSVNVNGSIDLTEKWAIRGIALGYDFRNERLTYPQLSLYRDLHCWEMDFFWAPRLNTFTFSIRVKPSSLEFLEVPYRRGNRF